MWKHKYRNKTIRLEVRKGGRTEKIWKTKTEAHEAWKSYDICPGTYKAGIINSKAYEKAHHWLNIWWPRRDLYIRNMTA